MEPGNEGGKQLTLPGGVQVSWQFAAIMIGAIAFIVLLSKDSSNSSIDKERQLANELQNQFQQLTSKLQNTPPVVNPNNYRITEPFWSDELRMWVVAYGYETPPPGTPPYQNAIGGGGRFNWGRPRPFALN